MRRGARTHLAILALATLLLAFTPAIHTSLTDSPMAQLPGVANHRVVTIQADAIRAAAASGQPLTIDLGERQVDVTLARKEVLAPGAAHVAANGTRHDIDLGDFLVAQGKVLNEEDTTVHLAVRGTSVEGFIRIGDRTWNIQPIRDHLHAVFRNDEMRKPPIPGIHDEPASD